MSGLYVVEDDAYDLDLKLVSVDDQLYQAWPHVHVRQNSSPIVDVVVDVEEVRSMLDRLKKNDKDKK